jgi:signal peptidase I
MGTRARKGKGDGGRRDRGEVGRTLRKEVAEPPRKARERGPRSALVEWARSIVIAAILYVVLRAFLVQTFVIISGSMEDALLVGDALVVNRAAFGSTIPRVGIGIPGYSEPRRGDVVVFDPPPPDTVGMPLAKRLIGLPGDTLEMHHGVLWVDGEAQEEPYEKHTAVEDDTHPWMAWQTEYLLPEVDRGAYTPTRDNWGPIVIPPKHYFVMGDNREASFDSRYWGLVERGRLHGRVVLIYYSYERDSYRAFPWLREVRWGRIGTVVRRRAPMGTIRPPGEE